ncbi:MAG: BatA domain-containing protein [Planctomycetota bacterium]|nr:BatA domain-containing protein [Planctomycetota bacterium]
MSFLTPYLLAGALAGALPILVHMIHRERPKVVPFTLLKFVHQASQTTRRSWRVKNLLLLLFRILLVVLFALILARPILKSQLLPATTGASQAAVVLDDSYLMNVKGEDERTDFDRAKEQASKLIRGLPQGSALALVPAVQDPLDFSIDLSSVVRALEVTQPSMRLPDCPLAVQRAYEMFGQSTEGAKEVYVFTNLSAGAWKPLPVELPEGHEQIRLIVVDVGEARPPNLSITEAAPSSFSVDRNSPIHIECALYNHGKETKCTVEMVFKGERKAIREVAVPANQAARVSIPYEFSETGLAQGKVRIVDEDALNLDNEQYFSVQVHEPVKVLLVQRDEENEDTFFLMHALSPTGLRGRERTNLVRIGQRELHQYPLETVDVILLANLTRLPRETWEKVFEFVRLGGGLGVIAGDAMDLEHFNSLPEIPLRIDGTRTEGSASLTMSPRDHRLLEKFKSTGLNAVRMSLFNTWLKVEPPGPENPMQVLARFGEEGPALLERQLEKGRILFFASSMETGWNELPKSFVFPPFVYELVSHLSGRRGMPTTFHPGDSVSIPLRQGEKDANIQVFEPGAQTPFTLAASPKTGRALHRIGETPGNAQVFIKLNERTRKIGYSVNIDMKAEHYQQISKEDLEKIFPNAIYLRPGEDISRNVAESARGAEVTPLLIALLILLMCMESMLANRFYK